MRTLIFLDPGIDCTGVAKFAWDKKPTTLQEALGCLVFTRSIETSPDDDLGVRLAQIGARVALLDADEFYVEIPTQAGMYKRHKGLDVQLAKSITKLYMAIGAIFGARGGLGYIEPKAVAASMVNKELRHEYLEGAARLLKIGLPEGPRGGKREDEYDAIWGGCQELLR